MAHGYRSKMQSDFGLETLVHKTIALYNRTRSPQVTAKLVLLSPPLLTLEFTGGFCYGCGVFDYVDGFAHQFKALSGSFELKVGKTRQVTSRSFEADFLVKNR
jgi:hypothetical protein